MKIGKLLNLNKFTKDHTELLLTGIFIAGIIAINRYHVLGPNVSFPSYSYAVTAVPSVGVGGGNAQSTGLIGNTGIPHTVGKMYVLPTNYASIKLPNGWPSLVGFWFASRVWGTPQTFGCNTVRSLAQAENLIAVNVGRYIAAKIDHLTNFFETPAFVAEVKRFYGARVTAAARAIFPACNFLHAFDLTKRIADDYIKCGHAGQAGLKEYFELKPSGVPSIATYPGCLGDQHTIAGGVYKGQ